MSFFEGLLRFQPSSTFRCLSFFAFSFLLASFLARRSSFDSGTPLFLLTFVFFSDLDLDFDFSLDLSLLFDFFSAILAAAAVAFASFAAFFRLRSSRLARRSSLVSVFTGIGTSASGVVSVDSSVFSVCRVPCSKPPLTKHAYSALAPVYFPEPDVSSPSNLVFCFVCTMLVLLDVSRLFSCSSKALSHH